MEKERKSELSCGHISTSFSQSRMYPKISPEPQTEFRLWLLFLFSSRAWQNLTRVEDGLYRVKIPHQPKSEFELELVAYGGRSFNMPADLSTMGMFTHGHTVYLFGGMYLDLPPRLETRTFYFDPHNIPPGLEFPMHQCDDQLMVEPYIFPSNTHIYFLSLFDHDIRTFSFQSFDLINNRFHPLQPPPLSFSEITLLIVGHFFVLDHIYLFIKQTDNTDLVTSVVWLQRAFSFNTRTSIWKELNSLVSEFDEQNIPIPYYHNGDTGLSDEFSDNIRILVALNSGKPTAYCVSLTEAGDSLHPKSSRLLIDHDSSLRNTPPCHHMKYRSHLLDVGNHKFCVIYFSQQTPLLVYTFKIDFDTEYKNIGKSVPDSSVVILSSKMFKHRVDDFVAYRFSSVCFASGPASQRCFPCHDGDKVNLPRKPVEVPSKPVDQVQGVVYVKDVDEMDSHAHRKESICQLW